MTVLKLLSNQGFISYNKIVAKELGVYEAILLGELCSIFIQFNCSEFYFTQDKICNDTALSVKQVRDAIKNLETAGFLTITKKGIPCKNWYFLKEDAVIAFFKKFNNGEQACSENNEQQDTPNLPNKEVKNGATGEANSEAQLNKNTSKNTGERIHNTICEQVAEKKKSTTTSKKTQALKEQEKIQIKLDSLSEINSLIFDRCVTTYINFRKSKDSKFGVRTSVFAKWKYDFVIFSEESSRTPEEILATLSFAVSDSWWSKCLYKPDTFIKNYDNIFMKANQTNSSVIKQSNSNKQPKRYVPTSQYL